MATQARNLKVIKREASNFIGYTLSNSQWAATTCDPGYFYNEIKPFGLNSPGYGGCCTTTQSCYPWTICNSGTLYGSGGSYICGVGYSCVSGIVATSQGAELEGDLFFICDTVSDWIAYRTTPSATPSITPVLSSLPPTSPTSRSISSATNSGSSMTTGPTATQTTSPSHSNVSGAAIAGAVVGPICGVALLLGLAFLFLRQRRSKPPAAFNGPNSHHPVSIPPAYPGTGNVETVMAIKDIPSPTMSHGAEAAAHSPVPIGLQSEAQVQQQIQSQQVSARRPVATELGTNPPVRGMPPELPENMGNFVNNV